MVDGKVVPDHRFMLRDGSRKPQTSPSSLLRLVFLIPSVLMLIRTITRVCCKPSTGEYEFVHRLADEYNERHAA